MDSAIAIMVDCQLDCETYTRLCKILKKQGDAIFPPWIHIRNKQTGISTKPQSLPDPHKGVQLTYAESVKIITTQRVMEDLGVQRYTASRYDMYLDTDATIRYVI